MIDSSQRQTADLGGNTVCEGRMVQLRFVEAFYELPSLLHSCCSETFPQSVTLPARPRFLANVEHKLLQKKLTTTEPQLGGLENH